MSETIRGRVCDKWTTGFEIRKSNDEVLIIWVKGHWNLDYEKYAVEIEKVAEILDSKNYEYRFEGTGRFYITGKRG